MKRTQAQREPPTAAEVESAAFEAKMAPPPPPASDETITLPMFTILLYTIGNICKKTYANRAFTMPDIEEYIHKLKKYKYKNINDMKMALMGANCDLEEAKSSSVTPDRHYELAEEDEDEEDAIVDDDADYSESDPDAAAVPMSSSEPVSAPTNVACDEDMSHIYLQIFHHLVSRLYQLQFSFTFGVELFKYYLATWKYYNNEDTYIKAPQNQARGAVSGGVKRQSPNSNALLDYFKNTDSFQSSISRSNDSSLFRFIHMNNISIPIKPFESLYERATKLQDSFVDYSNFDQNAESEYIKVDVNTKKLQYLILTPHVAMIYDKSESMLLTPCLQTAQFEREVVTFQQSVFKNELSSLTSDKYLTAIISKYKVVDILETNVDERIVNLKDPYIQRLKSIERIGCLKPITLTPLALSSSYFSNLLHDHKEVKNTAKSSFLMIHKNDHTRATYVYHYPNMIAAIVGLYKKYLLLALKKSSTELSYKKTVPITQNISAWVISNLNKCQKINPKAPAITVEFLDGARRLNLVDLPTDYIVADEDLEGPEEKRSHQSTSNDLTRYLKIFKTPLFVELKEQTKSAKSNVIINACLENVKFGDISHESDYDALNTKETSNDSVKAKINMLKMDDAVDLLLSTPVLKLAMVVINQMSNGESANGITLNNLNGGRGPSDGALLNNFL